MSAECRGAGSVSGDGAGRAFLRNVHDLKPAVENTRKFAKVYVLAQAANLPAMKFINVSTVRSSLGSTRPGS